MGILIDRHQPLCEVTGTFLGDEADMSEKRPRIDLEKALTELEEIVEQLEGGELPLEKSLKQFERGVKLSRECQGALQEAEQRVQVLMDSGLKDLDPDSLEERDTGAGDAGDK
jgi:exodeoxyribonuclease VII small subunit